MKVTSTRFENGGEMPIDYTADGQNISPPLRIDDIPQGTRELALIVEDPDAPRQQPFVHWVAYKIPPTNKLPEGLRPARVLKEPAGMMQGQNDKNKIGYFGPSPPRGHGQHHYHFRVYALDQPVEPEPAMDEQSLIASMQGHILDQAEIVGVYERPA